VPSYGNPSGTGSGVSTVTTSRWPAQLMGLMIAETPNPPLLKSTNYTLTLAGNLPRAWLAAGEHVGIHDAPIRGGRMGLTIDSAALSHKVNISLPRNFTWPAGCVVLRIRSPAWPANNIASATAGGTALPGDAIDATLETVTLAAPMAPRALANIVVKLA
jgi:hypothetical protein